MEGAQLGDLGRMGLIGGGGSGSGGDADSLGRGREDEIDSRSGSDNVDGASGDEIDPDNSNPRRKKKRYHRHTPQQIQELEAYVAAPNIYHKIRPDHAWKKSLFFHEFLYIDL